MAQLPSKQIPVSDIDKAFIDKQFTLLANVDSRLGKVLNYVVAIAAVIGGGLLLLCGTHQSWIRVCFRYIYFFDCGTGIMSFNNILRAT